MLICRGMRHSPDTQALLAALDQQRGARGTVELFDSLNEENPLKVGFALARAPLHTLRPELEAWMRQRGAEPPAPPGPSELLLAELEARLVAQERLARALQRDVEALRGLGDGFGLSANAYAAVSVVLAGVAALGWAAAFGLLPFTPEGPTPTIDVSNTSQVRPR